MSEWISVKDRLPDGLDDVLVHYDFGFITSRGGNYVNGDDYGVSRFYITHWMPLPEPPVDKKGGVIMGISKAEKMFVERLAEINEKYGRDREMLHIQADAAVERFMLEIGADQAGRSWKALSTNFWYV